MSSSKDDTPNHRPKVVIVGGGFGGLTCQSALQNSMPNADVTIVEPNERFTFLPLLYEYLGGLADLDEISPTYEYLLSSPADLTPIIVNKKASSSVSLERGSAVEVDPEKKLLHIQRLPSGESTSLHYDALVVSCGLPPSTPTKANRPGIPSSAFSFATLNDAVRLKRRLGVSSSLQGDSIVVVGGGYVGTELACALSKIVPKETKLTMLHRDATGVCTGAEASNREEAQKRLQSLGVNVKLGSTVENVASQTLDTGETFDDVQYRTTNGDKESIRADVLIWTVAGATKKPRQIVKGLPVDGRGRVAVSPTCQVEGMEHVYAIGDGAVVKESPGSDDKGAASPYPATAQVAMQQAQVVAYNLQVDLENKGVPKKFQYQSLGEMLSLGGDEDASISSLNGLFKLNGPLASTARRLVYAARMPTPKQAVRSGAGYVVGVLARGVGGLATEIMEKFAS
jgi:NADH dehydrogenase